MVGGGLKSGNKEGGGLGDLSVSGLGLGFGDELNSNAQKRRAHSRLFVI